MEQTWKQACFNAYQNIKNRIISIRFITLFMMLCFIFDLYLGDFRANVRLMEMRANVSILPFLQAEDYFMKLVFLGIVYFYSNVPFMEREQLSVLNRLGKRRWGRRNLSYIVGSSLILTLLLAVISILEVLSVGNISLSWDAVYKTLALTGGKNMPFMINYHIMRAFGPVPLFALTLLLDWMVITILGMLMYAVSLFGYRTAASIVGTLVVFLPSIDNMVSAPLAYFSPVSWLDCGNWRMGFDSTKPDLVYILVAGAFLIFVLTVICQARMQQMEWKVMDE